MVLRRCVVLRGTPEETRAEAKQLLGDADVLWTESGDRRALQRALGRSFDAVVLDAHHGFDADALGQAHGMIWAGGALILRRPHTWTSRFDAHVERILDRLGGGS